MTRQENAMTEPIGPEIEAAFPYANDLPETKGTYVLIAAVGQMARIEIGRLGTHEIIPGFYAYVGSAFGAGGLRARIGHHLELAVAPHWHIDYLLRCAVPTEVWFTMADRRLEHHWAELLEKAPTFRMPISRFGSSDYHRSRASHLFHAKRHPSFRWFQRTIREQFENVLAERCVLSRKDLTEG